MELIEQILQTSNLTHACQQVVRNGGAAGVDNMSVKELRTHLHKNRSQLAEQIRKCEYNPQAIRGKEIPKSNGKKRLLGIPTVLDRMLQQAVCRIIMPKYEYMFSEYSYAFRPQRNMHQAIQKALSYINDGFQDIVDIDLKGFFDEIDHCFLMQLLYRKIKCRATLCLIRRWLRVPILQNGKLIKRRKGIPQGSPLSPLLSNIVLHELDMELERLGLRFVRYADDFSIYCSSQKEASRISKTIHLFLQNKLKLPINHEKSGIRRPVNFKILGYGFTPVFKKGVKGQYQLVVEGKRLKEFKAELKAITRKTTPMKFEVRIDKLKKKFKGWINHFKFASMYSKLEEMDGWLRNRIRYCIWHWWKKPERRRINLIRLGVKPEDAYAWSRSRKGGWAIAQSPIMNTTITLERLKKRDYETMLDYYLKVCPHYKSSPLFPIA